MRNGATLLVTAFLLLMISGQLLAARVPPPRPHPTHHHRLERSHLRKDKDASSAAGASPKAIEPVEKVDEVQQIEQVESVEAVEPVAANADTPAAGGATAAPEVAGALRLAGHLHAASVHLPIAYLLLWAAIVLAGPALGMLSLNALARPLVWVGAASFAPAISTGLARWTELSASGSYDDALALKHRNLMFVALAATVVGIVLTEIHHRWPTWLTGRFIQLVAIGAAGLVAYSAHLGGQMVYGDDFLPF